MKLMTGNEALALGRVHAGVKVVTGYPGTPSTGALASLLEMQPRASTSSGASTRRSRSRSPPARRGPGSGRCAP